MTPAKTTANSTTTSSPNQVMLREASRHELSLIRFPERQTTWVVVMKVHLEADPVDLDERLIALTGHVPLVGARLRGEEWWADKPTPVLHATGDPLLHPEALREFDLENEAPLRIILGEHKQLALIAQHAAFDGLAMIALLRFLLNGPVPEPVTSAPAGPADGMKPYLMRLARPAHAVAPSVSVPSIETLVARTTTVSGRQTTGRMAAAFVAACVSHNARRGKPFQRVGITIPIAGPVAGVGNVAGYRRIDISPNDSVVDAVVAAIKDHAEPQLQVRSTRYLKLTRPLVPRLSDSILASNLGGHAVDGARRIDFYPVARGRSAVACGFTTVTGAESSMTLRARRLDQGDAQRILDEAVERFEASN